MWSRGLVVLFLRDSHRRFPSAVFSLPSSLFPLPSSGPLLLQFEEFFQLAPKSSLGILGLVVTPNCSFKKALAGIAAAVGSGPKAAEGAKSAIGQHRAAGLVFIDAEENMEQSSFGLELVLMDGQVERGGLERAPGLWLRGGRGRSRQDCLLHFDRLSRRGRVNRDNRGSEVGFQAYSEHGQTGSWAVHLRPLDPDSPVQRGRRQPAEVIELPAGAGGVLPLTFQAGVVSELTADSVRDVERLIRSSAARHLQRPVDGGAGCALVQAIPKCGAAFDENKPGGEGRRDYKTTGPRDYGTRTGHGGGDVRGQRSSALRPPVSVLRSPSSDLHLPSSLSRQWPWAPEDYGQTPQEEETGDQDGHTCRVVPGGNGTDAVGLAHLSQQQGAARVEHKGQSEPGKYAPQAAPDAQRVEFAQEQGKHQGRLHGADAAAGLINAYGAGANLDDVAMLDGRHAQEPE